MDADGQTQRWMDGWMDGWMDRQAGREVDQMVGALWDRKMCEKWILITIIADIIKHLCVPA